VSPAPQERRLLPITLAYLPIAAAGSVASFLYNVGATPDGRPSDVFLRGTPLAPPLFLPVLLVIGSWLARKDGWLGIAGMAFAGLVGLAFIGGSTFNLPNDLEAARAAGSPTVPVWCSPRSISRWALLWSQSAHSD
jgi:hypothetical protein